MTSDCVLVTLGSPLLPTVGGEAGSVSSLRSLEAMTDLSEVTLDTPYRGLRAEVRREPLSDSASAGLDKAETLPPLSEGGFLNRERLGLVNVEELDPVKELGMLLLRSLAGNRALLMGFTLSRLA